MLQRTRSHSYRILAAVVCTTAAGCFLEVEGVETSLEDDVAGTTEALNGTISSVTGCTPAQETVVRDAFAIVRTHVQQRTALIDCLHRGFVSGDDGQRLESDVDYYEWVIQEMSEPVATRIICQSTGSTNGTPEIVYLNTADIAGGKEYTAAVIAHEISHSKGYAHPGDRPIENQYSIPGQVGECIFRLATTANDPLVPLGTTRAAVTANGEIALPIVGWNGGAPLDQRQCGSQAFVQGIHGRANILGVSSIGLTCEEGSLGSGTHSQTIAQGGTTGTVYDLRCFPGETMVGAHGGGQEGLLSIGPVCALNGNITSGSLADFGNDPWVGAPGVVTWRRRCPAFHALKAIRLRADDKVQRVELVCQDTRSKRNLLTSVVTSVGGSGGERDYIEYCPGRGVIDRLHGVTHPTSGIRRLGAECAFVDRTSSGTLVISPTTTSPQLVPFHGGGAYDTTPNQHTAVAVECTGANELAVGLRAQVSGPIRSVRALCTNSASGWVAGTNSSVYASGRIGTNSGTTVDRTCPLGQFLVGWKIRAGAGVDSVSLRCRGF